MFQLDKILSKTNLKYVIAILWVFFSSEKHYGLYMTWSHYQPISYLDDSELFHTSILQFSKWAYNDMTYKIIKKTCHNFLAALQAKFNLIYVENHLYEVPLLYFSQLFRSQPLLETEKAVIMGKTVSSTADILCCLSDPGIDKPVVCICDVCMHVLIK